MLKTIEEVTVIKNIISKLQPLLHIFNALVGIRLSIGVGLIFININNTTRSGIKRIGNINVDKLTMFARVKTTMQLIIKNTAYINYPLLKIKQLY